MEEGFDKQVLMSRSGGLSREDFVFFWSGKPSRRGVSQTCLSQWYYGVKPKSRCIDFGKSVKFAA